jgi:pimeloyl-ACP methyl ester carboxylesterase
MDTPSSGTIASAPGCLRCKCHRSFTLTQTDDLPSVSGYENSLPNQAALLAKLAALIRAGQYTDTITASKVALVGHSYGSQLSAAVLQAAPELIDAALLTGLAFSGNPVTGPLLQHFVLTVFAGRLANTVDPPFARDNSYFGFGDIYAHAHGFFYPPFDLPTLEYAQSIYQPAAIAEIAHIPTPPQDPEDPLAGVRADGYTGALLLASGEHDLVCSGDCRTVFNDEYALQGKVFPNAEPLETYVHPGAGHGVNFARNSTGFFGELIGFLDRNLHS